MILEPAGIAVFALAALAGGLTIALSTLFSKPFHRMEDLVGTTLVELSPDGTVQVQGEIWKARSRGERIPARRSIRVLSRSGLRLVVVDALEYSER